MNADAEKETGMPIVCGTDFSDNATEAVHVAAALAQRVGARNFPIAKAASRGVERNDPSGAIREASARMAAPGWQQQPWARSRKR